MEKVLELIDGINKSPTIDTKVRRVHRLMRYLMSNMEPDWELTELLREKVTQWETEGMSKRKVKEYQTFLKSMWSKIVSKG